MKPLPRTDDLKTVSGHVIWFEDAETALADPVRFAAYAMTYGRHEDMQVLRTYLSDEDLREVLTQAPPGIFDGPSWAYWHLMLDTYPPPPMPERRFDERQPAKEGENPHQERGLNLGI